jgi:hypothetical protein
MKTDHHLQLHHQVAQWLLSPRLMAMELQQLQSVFFFYMKVKGMQKKSTKQRQESYYSLSKCLFLTGVRDPSLKGELMK